MLHVGHRKWRAAAITLTLVLGLTVPLSSHAGAASSAAGIVVQRGDRSSTVVAAQQLLLAAGIAVPGGADGIYGPGTAGAVSEFQRRRGLTITGAIDVPTGTLLGLVTPAPLLVRGATGAAVKTLQQRLLAAGVTVRGGADGVFGSYTQAALAAFQAAHGITATGRLDPGTDQVLTNAAGAPAAAAAPADTLQRGARGVAVMELQRQLAAIGLRPTGGADGIFGSATEGRVKEFQARAGLPVTGVADAATRAALAGAQPAASTPTPTAPPASPAAGGGQGVHLDFFPVPLTCRLSSSFGDARSGGRRHEGIDIMETRGTPVYATTTGTIRMLQTNAPLAGNAIWLAAGDGTYFFYAHLDRFIDGLSVGATVQGGTLIGYTGSTGNAGTPHLHLEVHPLGGAAVDPYPYLRIAASC